MAGMSYPPTTTNFSPAILSLLFSHHHALPCCEPSTILKELYLIAIFDAGGKMSRMITSLSSQEISCQQVMVADSSIFSIQWTDIPVTIAGALSAEQLLLSYIGYIRKCTLALIRPIVLKSGIEFRLLWTGISLISFLPPVYSDDFATLHICGGFLIQPRHCDRGELRFGVEHLPGSIRVSLQLSDFCPLILGSHSPSLIRFWLYSFTQAAIHRLVTVRFLSMLYHELAGPTAGVKIVNVAVKSGKPV